MRTTNRFEEIKTSNALRRAVIDDLITLVVPPKGMTDETVVETTEKVLRDLSVVASGPSGHGFTEGDLTYYKENLKGRIRNAQKKIISINAEDLELLRLSRHRLQGLPSRERDSHPVMRKHLGFLTCAKLGDAYIARA